MNIYNKVTMALLIIWVSNVFAGPNSDISNSNQSLQPQLSKDFSQHQSLALNSNGPKGTFVFNPKTRTWSAYNANGKLIKSGKGSGGQHYCSDVKRKCRTPVGKFAVFAKGSGSCKSSKYPVGKPGAPMPWCMFFHGNFAIHGSYHVPRYNASHGCIRVHPVDAYWLHHNFIRIGTTVIVRPY